MSDEKLLTREELAELLPLPVRTVRYLSERGRIPVIKISPHLVRYNLAAVRAAIAKCTVPAVEQPK